MLEDRKRTGSYYEAVMKNAHLFDGRVVLDVGTGSGILALFAAKAGASKVYAIEATDVAVHARTLMQANKADDLIDLHAASYWLLDSGRRSRCRDSGDNGIGGVAGESRCDYFGMDGIFSFEGIHDRFGPCGPGQIP